MSDYPPKQIRSDATAFTDSQFGKHYLARLRAAKKRAITEAIDITLSAEYRLQRGAQALAIEKELDYFRLAVMRVKEPTKFAQMFKQKAREEEPDVEV